MEASKGIEKEASPNENPVDGSENPNEKSPGKEATEEVSENEM